MAATNKATRPEQATKVVTGKVRFSYLHVFQPQQNDEGEDRYGVSLLIPKSDTKTLAAIEKAIDAAITAGKTKLADKAGRINKAKLKLPMRDGDEDRPDDEAYKGMMFVNANCKTKPGVVDRDCNPIMDTTELYSGCWGRASVNFYAFAGKSTGIACGLNNVQKLADGEPLGGRSNAEDDFADDYNEDDDETLL